ncbi:MAG: NADH-quinone oxidoreductase subunit NuoK [Gammaproteobacteria bacterium]|nr:NADH-quinone oxidoreductase subunit NuoK [Gammaproteobacteria bacterium]
MTANYLEHALLLAAMLFCLGLTGVLVRRNLLFMLICIEVMFNAAGLAFIVAGSMWGQAEGQIMFLAVITLGAAEVAVGLGMTLLLFRHFNSVNTDRLNHLRG